MGIFVNPDYDKFIDTIKDVGLLKSNIDLDAIENYLSSMNCTKKLDEVKSKLMN